MVHRTEMVWMLYYHRVVLNGFLGGGWMFSLCTLVSSHPSPVCLWGWWVGLDYPFVWMQVCFCLSVNYINLNGIPLKVCSTLTQSTEVRSIGLKLNKDAWRMDRQVHLFVLPFASVWDRMGRQSTLPNHVLKATTKVSLSKMRSFDMLRNHWNSQKNKALSIFPQMAIAK